MRSEFRRARSIKMSYERQGLIYFTLRTYADQPEVVKRRIDQLLMDAAGGDRNVEQGLREWLIKGEGLQQVLQKRYVCDQTMYKARKRLYSSW